MNVPKIRFKDFNDDYIRKNLKDVFSFHRGNTLSKADLAENGNNKCILYGELYTKYSAIANTIYSRTNNNNKNLVYGKKYDVLIPCSGETALDISTTTCLQDDNVIIGGDLTILRPLTDFGNYLSYYLYHKKKIEIAKYAQGDSVVHLYADKIKNLSLNLPTYEEQKKVSQVLELLDKKIELQTKKIEDLKLFKKGLFNNNIDNIKNIKLSDILTEVNIKSTINNQYEILSSTANGLYLQKDYFNKQAASENNTGYKILKRNQLVLSPQNLWMGNININDKYDIGIVSPSYKIFDIDDNIINIDFFNNWIKSPRALYDYMISSEQGASVVRRNLNIDLFNEIIIKVPERNIQDKIGKQIKNINMKIELENRKLDKLNDLKKGLMQNMFV